MSKDNWVRVIDAVKIILTLVAGLLGGTTLASCGGWHPIGLLF